MARDDMFSWLHAASVFFVSNAHGDNDMDAHTTVTVARDCYLQALRMKAQAWTIQQREFRFYGDAARFAHELHPAQSRDSRPEPTRVKLPGRESSFYVVAW